MGILDVVHMSDYVIEALGIIQVSASICCEYPQHLGSPESGQIDQGRTIQGTYFSGTDWSGTHDVTHRHSIHNFMAYPVHF